jgi:hypothetical protein
MCLQYLYVVQEIYSWKETGFNTVSLSHATVMQQIEDISSDTLIHFSRNSKRTWGSAMDESNDTSDTGQLLLVIQGITIILLW